MYARKTIATIAREEEREREKCAFKVELAEKKMQKKKLRPEKYTLTINNGGKKKQRRKYRVHTQTIFKDR